MTKELIIEDDFKNLEVKRRVKIGDIEINVPTKYLGNVISGVFPISTKRIKSIINTSHLRPIEIGFGKSVIVITIFNNCDTPVGPYKEIVLATPVLYNSKIIFPLLPLLFRSQFKNFGFFVFFIASDTELSRQESDFFGYPHYDKNINVLFQEGDEFFYANLNEEDKKILSFKLRKLSKEKIEKNNYKTYFIKEGNLFSIEMNTVAIVGRSTKKEKGILELGNHEIANILKNLEINLTPIEFSYYRNSIEVLNLPEKLGAT